MGKKKDTEKELKDASRVIRVTPPNFETLIVRVYNTPGSPLVTNMLNEGADMSNPDIERPPRGQRTKRDKMEEMLHAFYVIPGETDVEKMLAGKMGIIGLPASGFAKGMQTYAKDSQNRATLNAIQVQRNVFVFADEGCGRYVRVTCPQGGKMREDMVRQAGKNRAPMKRFRPEFKEWEATLHIRYDASVFSTEDVMNLLANTGQKIGQCELRPEKGYSCGMYEVDYESAKVTSNKKR